MTVRAGQSRAIEPGTQSASTRPGALRRAWRIASRLTLGIGATLVLSMAWFAGLPFTWGSPARRERWRAAIFRSWARAMLCIARVHLTVRGTPPAGPGFLVANHVGYVDVLVIGSRISCVFVSMRALVHWPLFGFMARAMGTIFIDREKKREIPTVNAAMERAIEDGYLVVLFPEGRSSNGQSVQSFRPSLLEPAARGARPVAWATTTYATGPGDPPASRAVPWSDMTLFQQVRTFLALGRVDATLTFGPDVVRDADRKRLAETLHQRIAGAFTPLA